LRLLSLQQGITAHSVAGRYRYMYVVWLRNQSMPRIQMPARALSQADPCCVALSVVSLAGVSAGGSLAAHGWVEPHHTQTPGGTIQAAGEKGASIKAP
jgi:hypothetical protein